MPDDRFKEKKLLDAMVAFSKAELPNPLADLRGQDELTMEDLALALLEWERGKKSERVKSPPTPDF